MTWLRCFAFLLLPLFVLVPDRPAAQAPARASFPPAEVPPRNDIRLDNRVAIPMRDGVILYADVYRPVGEGRFPVLVSRTPYSTERFPASHAGSISVVQYHVGRICRTVRPPRMPETIMRWAATVPALMGPAAMSTSRVATATSPLASTVSSGISVGWTIRARRGT